jgi:DNA-binding beta-propeller fold protein YncE
LLSRRLAARVATALVASLALAAAIAPGSALAAGTGTVAGTVPMRGMNVVLFAATPGGGRPTAIGRTRSRSGGDFSLTYRRPSANAVKYLLATRPGGGAEAGFPVPGSSYRLAAALGAGRVPSTATVNERTTVAMGFAMAQFIAAGRVAGANPGLRNAAAMTRDLVGRRNGGIGGILRRFPNGNSTSTMRTFGALANLVSLCRRQDRRCAQLLRLTGAPGGGAAADTLSAVVDVARYPWQNVRALYRLSLRNRGPFGPALAPGERPDAWTLALRFEGVPKTMNGPGNIAIDARGSIWVINNYEYARGIKGGPCAGEQLLRFTPTGRPFPGSPYEGGGLNGAGFGVSFDPRGRIWVGNFGFAARGCTKTPPSNSVSLFGPGGRAISPGFHTVLEEGSKVTKGGFEQGGISWPQGTVSDRDGNIWIANCGNGSLTRFPEGHPWQAENSGLGSLNRPFDIAVNAGGTAFVTSNNENAVAVYGSRGPLDRGLERKISGHGIFRPMGVAVDSRGYAWVANSGKVAPPCKQGARLSLKGGFGKGSVTLIQPNGEPALRPAIQGAGLVTPWGIAVDGNDAVWVANFSGQQLSEVCGTRPRLCPAGKQRTGASISPNRTGYGFDGLVRNTGVQIDPSGNVWLVNNWKQAPFQTNPGGHQLVAYLGLAAPIKTPLIGPPERP